jgi:hypothetical protein
MRPTTTSPQSRTVGSWQRSIENDTRNDNPRSRTLFKDSSIPQMPIANAELVGLEPVLGLSSVPTGSAKANQPPTQQAENTRSFIIFFRRELGRFIAPVFCFHYMSIIKNITGHIFPRISASSRKATAAAVSLGRDSAAAVGNSHYLANPQGAY